MEKLCRRITVGWFVWAYKPRRTKAGKYVWSQGRIVAGPFTTKEEALAAYPDAATERSLFNVRLCPDEVIRATAEGVQ